MQRGNVTSLGLAVLRLLDEGLQHPYEMRQRMREQGIDQLIKVTRGALYHTFDVLAKAELIELVETIRAGKRPERTVYAITDAGREVIRDRLRELLSSLVPEYSMYCVALAFMSVLSKPDAAAQLERRCVLLEAELAASITAYEALLKQGMAPIHVVEMRHVQAHLRADLDLTRAIVAEIRSGQLDWPARHDVSKNADAGGQ
jgi:DNA-binding PadR family transcriptional regulator